MRLRIGKYVLIWETWLPRVVRYVNLGEWRRKSKYVDAACRAAEQRYTIEDLVNREDRRNLEEVLAKIEKEIIEDDE